MYVLISVTRKHKSSNIPSGEIHSTTRLLFLYVQQRRALPASDEAF